MIHTALPRLKARCQALWPGLVTAAVIALAATLISEHYGGPLFLYALLFGVALNFLYVDGPARAGIDFAAQRVLRLGVALLGARITLGQIADLGLWPILLVISGVGATLLFGCLLARRMGKTSAEGLIGTGAVAICGASAALAIAAALPKNEENQRMTLLTVVSVTALSTLAMMVYPLLVGILGFSSEAAGVFFGGTIHDVAQVVGAGYLISPEAAETATFVKLFRVALLVPVVLGISFIFRHRGQRGGPQETGRLLPLFLLGFIALVLINSIGWLPPRLGSGLGDASRACLVLAIAALGVKTSFAQLQSMGWKPLMLIAANTLFLALWVLSGIFLLPGLK